MCQEDLKDLHLMHRGIHLYFPVMVPGTVIFGDQAGRMNLTQSIHGVRSIDVFVLKAKIKQKFLLN